MDSVSEAILEVSRELFSTGLCLLLNNAMEAKFWSVFKVGEEVFIIFSIHIFFMKFSINFYHVERGDGKQPRILVDNF